jgi:hypothetical protein
MKISVYLGVFLAFMTLTVIADAQKPKRPVPRPTPTPKSVVSADVIAAREKVSNQLSNVNVFVDRFGPIAQSIEDQDKEAQTKKVSKAKLAANDANKQKVIQAIRNLRTGLIGLETDFRTKPALQKYLLQIQGIGDLAYKSEDSAIAGKFVASKDPLRSIAQKLSDTMAVLPK